MIPIYSLRIPRGAIKKDSAMLNVDAAACVGWGNDID